MTLGTLVSRAGQSDLRSGAQALKAQLRGKLQAARSTVTRRPPAGEKPILKGEPKMTVGAQQRFP